METVEPRDYDWILEHSDVISNSVSAGKPILELGCGSGEDTIHLTKFGAVVATDINIDALQAQRAKSAARICLDVSKTFPFREKSFGFILASLSLHYFSWIETKIIVSEIKRVLVDRGNLIVRVNSTDDINYGAASGEKVEANFYRIENKYKRFFEFDSIKKLFLDWNIIQANEREIDRYGKPKFIWEIVLNAT